MNHGRWNEEEKRLYDKYILEYKNMKNIFKLISLHITTRTTIQIRTHHQKEFKNKNKLALILLKLSRSTIQIPIHNQKELKKKNKVALILLKLSRL